MQLVEKTKIIIGSIDGIDFGVNIRIKYNAVGEIDTLSISSFSLALLTFWHAGGQYKVVDFIDLNFDGFLDLYVHQNCSQFPKCKGKVFIFKIEEKNFEVDKRFDYLYNLSVNKEKKLIYSTEDDNRGVVYYRAFQNNGKKFLWLKEVKRYSKAYIAGDPPIPLLGYTYEIKKADEEGNLKFFKEITSPSPVSDPYFESLDE